MIHPSRTVSVAVDRPPGEVYRFVRDPENLPRWATAFCLSVRRTADGWAVRTPQGEVGFRFAEPNPLGVLDHVVTDGGEEVCVPMRVVPNGSGSEVLFTLFRLPSATEAQFLEDGAMVEGDLRTLKHVLEASS